MPDLPFMPLAVESWTCDTAHLTRAERGLYLDLLCLMWITPHGRVPNDLAWIARRLRCDASEVSTLKSLINEFCQSTGNWVTQKRLQQERERVANSIEKQRARAKSRWEKEKRVCRGNAEPAMPPIPIPIPRKERDTNVSPKKPRGEFLPDGWEPDPERLPQSVVDRIHELVPADDRGSWIEDQLDLFRGYWGNRRDARARMVDWDMAFHNWLRKACDELRKREWGRKAFASGAAGRPG